MRISDWSSDVCSSDLLADAYADRSDRLQVQGGGHVIAVLPDDRNGSQHQRFILKLDSGQTVLVAHNIDLAPRIEGLHEGDLITFSGEYAWNEDGGVVHRSEEHTSELQSLMRISYAVFCLKKKNKNKLI